MERNIVDMLAEDTEANVLDVVTAAQPALRTAAQRVAADSEMLVKARQTATDGTWLGALRGRDMQRVAERNLAASTRAFDIMAGLQQGMAAVTQTNLAQQQALVHNMTDAALGQTRSGMAADERVRRESRDIGLAARRVQFDHAKWMRDRQVADVAEQDEIRDLARRLDHEALAAGAAADSRDAWKYQEALAYKDAAFGRYAAAADAADAVRRGIRRDEASVATAETQAKATALQLRETEKALAERDAVLARAEEIFTQERGKPLFQLAGIPFWRRGKEFEPENAMDYKALGLARQLQTMAVLGDVERETALLQLADIKDTKEARKLMALPDDKLNPKMPAHQRELHRRRLDRATAFVQEAELMNKGEEARVRGLPEEQLRGSSNPFAQRELAERTQREANVANAVWQSRIAGNTAINAEQASAYSRMPAEQLRALVHQDGNAAIAYSNALQTLVRIDELGMHVAGETPQAVALDAINWYAAELQRQLPAASARIQAAQAFAAKGDIAKAETILSSVQGDAVKNAQRNGDLLGAAYLSSPQQGVIATAPLLNIEYGLAETQAGGLPQPYHAALSAYQTPEFLDLFGKLEDDGVGALLAKLKTDGPTAQALRKQTREAAAQNFISAAGRAWTNALIRDVDAALGGGQLLGASGQPKADWIRRGQFDWQRLGADPAGREAVFQVLNAQRSHYISALMPTDAVSAGVNYATFGNRLGDVLNQQYGQFSERVMRLLNDASPPTTNTGVFSRISSAMGFGGGN